MKKYAVKNDPKSMISEAMKRSMPSTGASTRELLCASGGCAAWWAASACVLIRRASRAGRRPPPAR
jgi:hypothetical protein